MDNNKYPHIWHQVLASVIIAGIVFAGGFYAGKKEANESQPSFVTNATSTQALDMAPFWKVWRILDEKFSPPSSTTAPVTAQDKLWGAVEGLAASYKDPYTVFFPPVESKAFEEEISGSFSGVGMEIAVQEGVLTVVTPLKGTPAFNAGVKPGDKIISINGVSAIRMSTDEAIKLIRGEEGTTVAIIFARQGVSGLIEKKIVRAPIEIPTVNTKTTPEGVFVIELYNFSAVSPNLFRQALREFIESGSDKLVIDLRNNPGGFLEAAMDMASWFLPVGKTVVTEDFAGDREDQVYRSKGYDVFTDRLKMAILINEGSASASEILAGALREYDKAVLVGQKSFGKGSVQELIPVTENTSLKVTVAHWLTPLGKSISNGGIVPDIEVQLTTENTKNGADPVLDAAVKYLLGK